MLLLAAAFVPGTFDSHISAIIYCDLPIVYIFSMHMSELCQQRQQHPPYCRQRVDYGWPFLLDWRALVSAIYIGIRRIPVLPRLVAHVRLVAVLHRMHRYVSANPLVILPLVGVRVPVSLTRKSRLRTVAVLL